MLTEQRARIATGNRRFLPSGTLPGLAGGGAILALLALVAVILTPASPAAVFLALGLYTAAATVAGLRIGVFHPHPVFGLANAVTLGRLMSVSLLAGAAVEIPALMQAFGDAVAWVLAGLALLTLSLDGLDGWAARRRGLCSAFGARFDMEVDSLLALVLAALAVGQGTVGAWLFTVPAMRYVFVGAGIVWPVLTRPLPPSFRRKAVCVVQLGVLTALLVPPVHGAVAQLLGGVALMAVAASFAVDLRWLLTTGRRTA